MGLIDVDLYSHRVIGRAIITFEIDSTGVTCRRVRASEPAPCCASSPEIPRTSRGRAMTGEETT